MNILNECLSFPPCRSYLLSASVTCPLSLGLYLFINQYIYFSVDTMHIMPRLNRAWWTEFSLRHMLPDRSTVINCFILYVQHVHKVCKVWDKNRNEKVPRNGYISDKERWMNSHTINDDSVSVQMCHGKESKHTCTNQQGKLSIHSLHSLSCFPIINTVEMWAMDCSFIDIVDMVVLSVSMLRSSWLPRPSPSSSSLLVVVVFWHSQYLPILYIYIYRKIKSM